MELLAAALVENLIVTEIDLRGNRLGDRGAIALAPGLAQSDTVVKLRVGQNGIGCRGAIALLTGNALQQLYLDENHVNEDDTSLAPKKIWAHPAAGSEGMELLGEALGRHPTLEHLSLSGNKLGCVGLARMSHGLQEMRAIMVLDLSNNHVGDKGATHLARALLVNNMVLDLNLNNNKVSDKGGKRLLQVLLNNAEIYRFDLGRNKVRESVARDIATSVRENQRRQVQERYIKSKTKRTEAPHTPQYHRVKVRVIGKHVESAMDDLVEIYDKENHLGKYAASPTPAKALKTPKQKGGRAPGKTPGDRKIEMRIEKERLEEEREKFKKSHKAFVPVAYDKSKKNNALAKVKNDKDLRFGRVNDIGETVDNEIPPSFKVHGV